MPVTMSGAASATTIGKEVATFLAREIAHAIHQAPSFMGGSAVETFSLAIGNTSLGGSVHLPISNSEATAPSVAAALGKEIYSLLKSEPMMAAAFKDAAKVGGVVTLTRDPVSLKGSGTAITLSDATKITFHSVDQLSPKHFG